MHCRHLFLSMKQSFTFIKCNVHLSLSLFLYIMISLYLYISTFSFPYKYTCVHIYIYIYMISLYYLYIYIYMMFSLKCVYIHIYLYKNGKNSEFHFPDLQVSFNWHIWRPDFWRVDASSPEGWAHKTQLRLLLFYFIVEILWYFSVFLCTDHNVLLI